MPLGVVDILEIVQIDEEKAHLARIAFGKCQGLMKPVEKETAIGKPGEGVVVREPVNPLLGVFQRGDVFARGHDPENVSRQVRDGHRGKPYGEFLAVFPDVDAFPLPDADVLQLIRHNRQGFIGWFIRQAVENREIQIYGDGRQLRDFVYVDDAADAFLRAGANDRCNGEVFNVGGDRPISHRELTTLILEIAGSGRVEYVPWPADKKAIDIGSFYADSSKFRAATGWIPTIPLRDGLASTLAFYRANFAHYVDAAVRTEQA